MGDSINMAARLMCHPNAAAGILCDEKTFNLCEGEYEFERLGETKVKGKESPISIFRPIAFVPESNKKKHPIKDTDTIDLIGREKEKKAIEAALHRISTTNSPDIVIVQAESGQGLSTLVNFAKNEAMKQNCHVW